ncbi:MAG TPA: hypothetical protein VMC42_00780 [Methanoregulaceae archaeon]|nr:hypothetical protein [Methanoregulaceae archaeon]
MGTLRRLCIVAAIIPVFIIYAVQAGPLGPPGMLYRTLVDEKLGFSITVPVYWYGETTGYQSDRSHTVIKDPLSRSVIIIDCLWTRNDAYPFFYSLDNWPGNDTAGQSAEQRTVNDGLLSLAGVCDYSGPVSYYLYNETRYPGRGSSKFEYEVASFVPDPSPMMTTDNDLIVEQALRSVRVFDPAQKPENLIQLPLYPGMIGPARSPGVLRTDRDSKDSQIVLSSPGS